jgi:hypothetical protein
MAGTTSRARPTRAARIFATCDSIYLCLARAEELERRATKVGRIGESMQRQAERRYGRSTIRDLIALLHKGPRGRMMRTIVRGSQGRTPSAVSVAAAYVAASVASRRPSKRGGA